MKLIDKKEVQKITSLSPSTIWRLEKTHQFPQRIQVSTRAVRWIESQVTQWIKNKAGGNK